MFEIVDGPVRDMVEAYAKRQRAKVEARRALCPDPDCRAVLKDVGALRRHLLRQDHFSYRLATVLANRQAELEAHREDLMMARDLANRMNFCRTVRPHRYSYDDCCENCGKHKGKPLWSISGPRGENEQVVDANGVSHSAEYDGS